MVVENLTLSLMISKVHVISINLWIAMHISCDSHYVEQCWYNAGVVCVCIL